MGPETNPSTVTEAIARLRVDRDDLARSLTETYFADHPEFESEHPPQARLRTREDFGYLVDFLVGALAAGNPATFVDMVLWTAHVLENRRIPRPVLVDSLHRIEREIASRYAEPMAAQATRYLAIGVGALNLPAGATPIKAAAMPQLDHASRIYLQAILQGDRQAALSVASEALASGTRIADVYLNMIQTSMYEVGRRWEANQITVADEHLATAITQWVLAQLYDRLDIPNPHRGRVIVTGIEGELHQVGRQHGRRHARIRRLERPLPGRQRTPPGRAPVHRRPRGHRARDLHHDVDPPAQRRPPGGRRQAALRVRSPGDRRRRGVPRRSWAGREDRGRCLRQGSQRRRRDPAEYRLTEHKPELLTWN
jgi:hypothetical protein